MTETSFAPDYANLSREQLIFILKEEKESGITLDFSSDCHSSVVIALISPSRTSVPSEILLFPIGDQYLV